MAALALMGELPGFSVQFGSEQVADSIVTPAIVKSFMKKARIYVCKYVHNEAGEMWKRLFLSNTS